MSLVLSNVFHRNKDAYLDDSIRYVINQGGTSSTKTFSTLQLLTWIAINHNKQIDICSENVPHLKKGVINDMKYVCEPFGINFESLFNASDKFISFPNGGTINFIALDNAGKAHGGRRDILYINEANCVRYPIAEQLMIRTREKIFIDYNPTGAFWVHNQILSNAEEKKKSIVIKSTYKDNPRLEQTIIDSIEAKRGDGKNNFWRVYGLGELGVAEGLIFDNFEQDNFDKERFASYYFGLDWGFSQDPFACVRMAIENNKLYICNEVYQKGLLNKHSAPLVKEIAKNEVVVCDSAEPKSIKEFKDGVKLDDNSKVYINAIPAKKGAGSIEFGIKKLQSFDKIVIHNDCVNVYNEFCNYQWKKDKDGEPLDIPIDAFNHAIDAIRYALELYGNKQASAYDLVDIFR